jgi:hypothetical protein
MADEPDDLEVKTGQPHAVRETHNLFRLTPVMTDERSDRQSAVVAADTEQEARMIAYLHDIRANDWQDPAFATCDLTVSDETHVVGDVLFVSSPGVAPEQKPKKP